MGHGLPRSRKQVTGAVPCIRADIPVSLTLTNIDGATGNGWDTAVVSGLPVGHLLILGGLFTGTITEASANIGDTFDGDIAFGTAPGDDATPAGAQVDLIPLTALGAAVSSVNTVTAATTGTEVGTVIDNTAGTAEINMTLVVDDADISADDESAVVEGNLRLIYTIL